MNISVTRDSWPAVAVFDNYWAPTLAFARSLGRRRVPLHVYGSGGARWSRYRKRTARCPPVQDAESFVPWLRERVRSGEIQRVAPTTDLVAYYTAVLRDEFPTDVQRTIPSLAEIETVLIKSRFSAACASIGQAVPDTRTPTDLGTALNDARELGYPLILKPKSHIVVGTAERGALIHDERELRQCFRRYEPTQGQAALAQEYPELLWPILQRYVPSARSRVYSVSGFKDVDQGIVAAALSYKREQWPVDVGTSTVQVSSGDEQILNAGLNAVNQIVSRGIFELELLVDHGRLMAIDLNPRAFGFINLDIARGNDLPWLWFQSTLGPVEPVRGASAAVALEARHAPLYFLRHFADWRVGSPPPRIERRDPARPRRRISIQGDWSDPLPMLICHAVLLRHPRSLLRAHFGTSRAERERQEAETRTLKAD